MNKVCIVCDLPDGLNVFVGFDCLIDPVTGTKMYFNVWDTNIKNAKFFRSMDQGKQALKIVSKENTNIFARVEFYDKILEEYNKPG